MEPTKYEPMTVSGFLLGMLAFIGLNALPYITSWLFQGCK